MVLLRLVAPACRMQEEDDAEENTRAEREDCNCNPNETNQLSPHVHLQEEEDAGDREAEKESGRGRDASVPCGTAGPWTPGGASAAATAMVNAVSVAHEMVTSGMVEHIREAIATNA